MMATFYVIDGDCNISWNPGKDRGESFSKREAAFKRAREIAESEPGKPVHIAQAIEVVVAPVGKVERCKAM